MQITNLLNNNSDSLSLGDLVYSALGPSKNTNINLKNNASFISEDPINNMKKVSDLADNYFGNIKNNVDFIA
jgi:hypothetical protein